MCSGSMSKFDRWFIVIFCGNYELMEVGKDVTQGKCVFGALLISVA